MTWLSKEEVRSAALTIAREKLKSWVLDVQVDDDIDLDGRPGLRVTIVLKPGKSLLSRGRETSGISLALLDFMLERGDERHAFVHYATEADLEEFARGE